jgi:hypothetical protein
MGSDTNIGYFVGLSQVKLIKQIDQSCMHKLHVTTTNNSVILLIYNFFILHKHMLFSKILM